MKKGVKDIAQTAVKFTEFNQQAMDSADKPAKKFSLRENTIFSWMKNHIALLLTGFCFLLLICASAFIINKYSNRSAPGTNISGINVSGKNAFAIRNTINDLENAIKLTLSHDGKAITANFVDLGINIDIDKTTNLALLTSNNWLNRLNIFGRHDVELVAKIDWNQTTKFLNESFPELITDSRNAGVIYNNKINAFETQSSSAGKIIDLDQIRHIVEDLVAHPRAAIATVAVVESNPPISDEAAQTAANYANERLNLRMNLNSEGRNIYFPDPPDIADWTIFEVDNSRLKVKFDEEKIKNFISNNVANTLPQKPIDAQAIAGADGRILREISGGSDGKTIENVSELSKKMIAALENNSPLDADLKLKKKAHSTKKTIAEDNHWVEANLSDYSVKLYNGTELVWQTNSTSHGKPSTPTITGLFKVFAKVFNQCMPNPGPNGEPAPPLCNIHYVTYWGPGGYAFHEAWWLTPATTNAGISHGCVNMRQADAKMVYDFSSIGTPVWVHY